MGILTFFPCSQWVFSRPPRQHTCLDGEVRSTVSLITQDRKLPPFLGLNVDSARLIRRPAVIKDF